MVDSEDTLIGRMDVVTCRRRCRRNESLERVNECESLLIEILVRLHCIEAIKSKLVCKRWNSIISSDYFVTAFNHRRHDPSLPPIPHDSSYRLIFQFFQKYEYSSIVHCGSDSQPLLRRNLDFDFLPSGRIVVVASCDDLILCASMGNRKEPQFKNYFVCNLQTKQWFALPTPLDPHKIDYSATGFLCIPSPCSLCQGHEGVDYSRYKFMVLRIHGCSRDDPNSLRLKVELFLSEEGEWKRHEVLSPLDHLRPEGKMVPYNGMLHWLNLPHVLVFDQYGQISHVIDAKFVGIRRFPPICSFDVHQDRLRLVYMGAGMYGYDDYYSIWELEDDDSGRWSCVKTFGCPREPGIMSYFHPEPQSDGNAAYCTNGRGGNTCIWFHNLLSQASDRRIKFVPRNNGGHKFVSVKNVHRVTDQWWPTPVPSLGT